MDIAKLFRVLVVGGSLIAAPTGCGVEKGPEPPKDEIESAAGTPDASESRGSDAAMMGNDGRDDIQECGFCRPLNERNEACCEYDEAGVGTPRDGFQCCWGSTC